MTNSNRGIMGLLTFHSAPAATVFRRAGELHWHSGAGFDRLSPGMLSLPVRNVEFIGLN